MHHSVSEDEREFRQEVRSWLNENAPQEKVPPVGPEHRAFMLEWQRKKFEGGWAGLSWPSEYGGRGLSLLQQVIWYEEYVRADAPDEGCLFVGLNHGGPTLIHRGDDAQKSFHLPRILKGETIWCQGFSEPGAGSDLANIRTKGVIDGDSLVVDGQKIWTSYAHIADYQMLLVRTDPGSVRHRGLTWVINDLSLPGITIRPIENLFGGYEFCEVFYDNVRIPLANVVGEVNDGWSVTISTLSLERGASFMARQITLSKTVERLIELARTVRAPGGFGKAIDDTSISSRLAGLRAEVAALQAMTYMGVSRIIGGGMPGPEGTMVSLCFGELIQKVHRAAMDILGPQGLFYAEEGDDWTTDYLDSFARTIGGGTSEIRRNIIGERVLGLPRDR